MNSVFILDGDPKVRRHLVRFLRAHSFEAVPFASGTDFVEALNYLSPGICLIGQDCGDMGGMAVLDAARAMRQDILFVMTAEHATIPLAVRAIKAGAADFMEKPFDDGLLLKILANLEPELKRRVDLVRKHKGHEKSVLALNQRECAVMNALLKYSDNGTAADKLHISIRTVESYRSRIIKKMRARNFADALMKFQKYRESGPLVR